MRSVGPVVGADGMETINEDTIGLEVSAQATPTHDARRLLRGFLPDPREARGVAGGTVDVAPLGGDCHGYVRAQPTHVLTLQCPPPSSDTDCTLCCTAGESAFDYLRIFLTLTEPAAESSPRLVLIVRDPDGRFLCATAPAEGAPLHFAQEAWAEGRYLLWVGSVVPGPETPYDIAFTEERGTATQ
jgi:hypothetical protein